MATHRVGGGYGVGVDIHLSQTKKPLNFFYSISLRHSHIQTRTQSLYRSRILKSLTCRLTYSVSQAKKVKFIVKRIEEFGSRRGSRDGMKGKHEGKARERETLCESQLTHLVSFHSFLSLTLSHHSCRSAALMPSPFPSPHPRSTCVFLSLAACRFLPFCQFWLGKSAENLRKLRA